MIYIEFKTLAGKVLGITVNDAQSPAEAIERATSIIALYEKSPIIIRRTMKFDPTLNDWRKA